MIKAQSGSGAEIGTLKLVGAIIVMSFFILLKKTQVLNIQLIRSLKEHF
jgi:hypothetical protein